MDGESEGLRRQVARLDLTIQAEMEKGKVLQVKNIPTPSHIGSGSPAVWMPDFRTPAAYQMYRSIVQVLAEQVLFVAV